MRGAVVRMLVTIVGAGLMLAGGLVLLTRRTIELGSDGSAYIGFADNGVPFPAMPVAAVLLITGFVVVVVTAVVGAVRAGRSTPSR